MDAEELLRSFLTGGGGVAGTPRAAERVRRRPSTSGARPFSKKKARVLTILNLYIF